MQLPPNQQSSPMVMGRPYSGPRVPLRRTGSVGWVPLKKLQFGPMIVRSPTVMGLVSIQVLLELTYTFLPSLLCVRGSRDHW